nr:Myb/SANT-like DNA-binding domain protein [Ipomoea batatas]
MQSRHSHHPKLLQIQLNHRVGKHTRISSGVPFGYIDDIRLQNDCVKVIIIVIVGPAAAGELVDRGDAPVVIEAVLAADDAEAEDVVVVVEDLEALGAGGGGDAGDDGDFPDAADAAVAGHAAALDEMLVLLRVVEAADDGPHHARRRVDVLRDQRRACVGHVIEEFLFSCYRLLICHLIVKESEEENRTRQGFEDLLYSQDNQHSSQLHDLEVDESSFWNNFMSEVNHCVGNQDVSGTQVPRQSQSNNVRKCAETQNIGLKPTQMKRKRRQSGGAAQLSSQLDSLISNSNRALDVLIGDSTVNTQSTTTVSLAAAISVINRMVTDGIMEKGGDLWCFSLSFLKDDLNREIFFNIDDDFSRKAWLKYMHDTSK